MIGKYEQIEPSVGKKKRKMLVNRIKELTEELENKADQIYALYDVLESPDVGNAANFEVHQHEDENLTKNLLGRHTWINV